MGVRRRLESSYDYEIVDEFLDHFDVMTEVMEPTIIAIENASDPEKRREKIDELFRLFHNIKSASAFLKIERLNLLAELAEEMVYRLRDDPASVDSRVIDWLLAVHDQMRHWYEQIAADEELEETDPNLLKLPESYL